MYVLCILDVQPGFEESVHLLEPVHAVLSQAIADKARVILAQFKGCGEYPILKTLDYPYCKVWHTKKDRVQAVRRVVPFDLPIHVCGLYTELFLKDLVRGLSRRNPVRVLSKACYGSEDALDHMRSFKNVTVV
jgi:hypothetical protein